MLVSVRPDKSVPNTKLLSICITKEGPDCPQTGWPSRAQHNRKMPLSSLATQHNFQKGYFKMSTVPSYPVLWVEATEEFQQKAIFSKVLSLSSFLKSFSVSSAFFALTLHSSGYCLYSQYMKSLRLVHCQEIGGLLYFFIEGTLILFTRMYGCGWHENINTQSNHISSPNGL